jgi:3-oxoacyl-[acyl-carrier protein] reductase
MSENSIPKSMVITGTSRGIGKALAEHYLALGWSVFGCSRGDPTIDHQNYRHTALDVADEKSVQHFFSTLRQTPPSALLNNAGVAAMNHFLLTPKSTLDKVLNINVVGTFLFCREAARLMQRMKYGRIVNFATVATPLKLEGEAIYAASKAAVVTLTQILARELGSFGITVNAVGPTPIKTDLIQGVPEEKLTKLLERQAIQRFGTAQDVANVTDFFLSPTSDFITGQIVYLGGV